MDHSRPCFRRNFTSTALLKIINTIDKFFLHTGLLPSLVLRSSNILLKICLLPTLTDKWKFTSYNTTQTTVCPFNLPVKINLKDQSNLTETFMWFGLFPVRSPLLRKSLRFLFLWLLRCFTSPGLLHAPMNSAHNIQLKLDGFPHWEISGSKVAWDLTEAYRTLQRPSSSFSVKAFTIRP